jgi:hypothetical protein
MEARPCVLLSRPSPHGERLDSVRAKCYIRKR